LKRGHYSKTNQSTLSKKKGGENSRRIVATTKSDLQAVLYFPFSNCHYPKKDFLRDIVKGEI